MKERKPPAITATTKTQREALVSDLLESRKLGYFVTRGENVSDVWAVATFLTVNNETVAVAVAGPQHRIETNVAEVARLLVASCSFLARQVGRE